MNDDEIGNKHLYRSAQVSMSKKMGGWVGEIPQHLHHITPGQLDRLNFPSGMRLATAEIATPIQKSFKCT